MYYDAHEIVSGIYLGNHKIASNLNMLNEMKITHVVNCAKELPNSHNSFVYRKYPLDDSSSQNIEQYFEDSYNFIDHALNNEGRVFVHCYAGISRSATILTSYLAKKYNISPESALLYIKSIRDVVSPNPGFLAQLSNKLP